MSSYMVTQPCPRGDIIQCDSVAFPVYLYYFWSWC